MEKITLNVEGMSCGHCVKAVTNAVCALDGVSAAEVSLETKTATVEYDANVVTAESMKTAIEDEGFTASF